jgi:META domain
MTSSSSFKTFLVFILATVLSTMVNADIYNFAENWKVLEAYDTIDSTTPRELPSSLGHAPVFHISRSDKSPTDTLNLGCKVGNSMRTSVKITGVGDDANSVSIQVGLVMSTMMMPPEDQYGFEMFLSGALPKMTSMTLEGQELVMAGDAKIVLQAVETSDV